MDTDIRKTNKIPGCEQLTRPEEIAALSKYLGEIKRIQEEHTKLVDEGLEVPGRTTGRIPEVSELGDAVLSLEDTREKTLENTRLGITGDKRTVELETEKERLTDTKEIGLSQKKERLEDSRETRLETKSEVLKDQRQITLGDKKEELRDNRNNNLSEKTERISIDPKIDRLETKSEVLEDQRKQLGLETKVVEGEKNEQPTLSKYTDSLDVQQENTLGNYKENLQDTKEEPSLTDYVIGLVNEDRVSGLSDSVTPLNNSREVESLGDHKETIDPEEIENLGNHKETIEPRVVENLRGQIKDLDASPDPKSLEDYKETIEPSKDLENFGTTKDNTTINPEDVNLETNKSDWLRGVIQAANAKRDEDGLYNTAIHLFSEEGTEWSERVAALMSTYLSGSRISPERAEEFEELLASSFVYPGSTPQQLRPENQTTRDGGNYVDPDEIKNNPFVLRPNLYRREDNNNGDGPTRDNKTWDYDENGNYVLTTGENEDDARNNPPSFGLYRDNGLIRTPQYDLNIGPADASATEKWKNIGIKALNKGGVSSYLRYAAEQVVGIGDWTRGSLRTQLINEALALLVRSRDQLEKVAKINKDRLPGDDNALVSGLAKAASGGLGSALGQYGYTGYDPKAGVQSLIKTGVNIGKNIAGDVIDYFSEKKSIPDYGSPVPSEPFNRPKVVGKEGNKILTETTKYGYGTNTREFRSNELGSGFLITLKDLCGKDQGAIKTGSLEELQKILTESELITTASKINKRIQRTLDSNMYWEVVLKPWAYNLGDKYSNGGYSFLPSIKEINTINRVEHGVDTTYNKWIPISNFELQKSKLTTKSLGLFDGEINYPVTSEYTNEFRMTVVDDQWKSWKHYFQKCSDVSVYNSEPHPIDYYKETNPIPTAIDKSTLCAAFYKNIAFSIEIYIMTPQMSTIRKFHILAILRDFSEEYTGESDSGGSDLNVSFSIVGEVDDNDIYLDDTFMDRYSAKKEIDTMLNTQSALNTKINYTPFNNTQSPLVGFKLTP